MKKIILLLICIWVSMMFAVTGTQIPASATQAFQITSRSGSSMDISFRVPEYEITEETLGTKTYHHIQIAGSGSLLEQGLPELPTLTTSIAIPARGSVSIEAIGSQVRQLGSYLPYPVQQGRDLDSPKGFVIDNAYYTGGSAYPEAAIQYSDPYILRDLRIVSVQVNPFIYDPQTGILSVRESIDLRVHYNSAPGLNEMNSEPLHISPAFAKLYEFAVLNFNDFRPLVETGRAPRYVLIYGNNTDPAFQASLDQFVLWKRQKGADVRVASTSVAGTSTTAIKTYLQNLYNDQTTRPDFVILMGDVSGSYTIPAFTVSGGGGDYPYTHLDGTDGVGDVFIGRISAENLSQLQVILNKIYLYERDLDMTQAAWLNRGLLVGDTYHSGISTIYINKYLKEIALRVNPDYTFTELLMSQPSPSNMNAAINQGIGIMNYRGYLGMSGWSPSESLFNGFKLPHAVIITCGTGNYATGTGTTETFIRLGTTASPKGAVTAIGMSTSSTHTTFNNCLNGGIIAGMYQSNMRTMGEVLLAGKVYINQIFGVSSPSNATSFAHWCNLMGDPTMEFYAGIPGQFTVNVANTIPVGLSLLDIAVSDTSGVVEGACVTLTATGAVVSRGYTDAEGNVILILPDDLAAGTGIITVSRHDYKPMQMNITISATPTLVPGAVTIDDDSFGASSGNGNGIANSGETLELQFGLQNTGTTAITAISGQVTSTNPYVTFTNPNVSYGTIAGGNLGFSTSPIVMQIAHNAPHQGMIRLHLILQDGSGNNYDVSEFVPVESARFTYNSLAVVDGGNAALDPNETAALNITVTNSGTNAISAIYGRLYSLNDLVTISDNIGYFGDVNPGAQISTTVADNFTVFARETILPGMIIPMRLKLYNALGYEQFLDFTLSIGVVTVHDPLGPDAYGYVIYDDQDTSYDHCPTYSWVGIAPAEGGVGTSLNLSDSYSSGDEGDQVGATSIVTVNLPFPFQFYGRLYSQASISTNGFIAMGASTNAEFRNFRLPGAMGPSPMIAPFWDDLATHSGGNVYTWFDRNNHAFVVEWYNMKNGHGGSAVETFQVILYDQSVYATSLGDGPIKFQYNTFNNIDSQSGTNQGAFATIGIEDHTGLRGLEYTFNNVYPLAASQLGNQRAIYITNIPVFHQAAHLIVGETYLTDGNGNNVAEPGETVQLGIQVNNIGNAPASGIVGTLSCEDEFITLNNTVSNYYPMEAEENGVNRTPYSFTVAQNCPDGHVVNFNLSLVAGEETWERPFSIRIDASKLSLYSILINDADATYNGVIDINEAVKLIVNVKNATAVEARDVIGTLSTEFAGVTIANPSIDVAGILPNNIMQFVYDLQFSGNTGSGTSIPFSFSSTSSNALAYQAPLYVPYNVPNEYNNFDMDNADFVSELGWAWGHPSQVTPYSGANVWATGLSGTYPSLVDYKLYSGSYLLTTNSVLTLRHNYTTESGYDGGNVSISTNGGTSWTLLNPNGGYPSTNITGLNGEAGYSGSSGGWQLATFNLNQYTGQTVMFRFRFGSDGATSAAGWFLDDFDLAGVDKKTGYLHGLLIPTSEFSPTLATVHTSNNFAAHPNNEGLFRVYLKNGTYYANADMKNHQSSSFGPFTISPQTPQRYTEFTLIYLPKPFSTSWVGDNETGLLTLSWTEPYDPVLPVIGYKVYRRFDSGPFVMVQETTQTQYTETLSLVGIYQYYVRVKYINVDGSPSDTLTIAYPFEVDNNDPQTPGMQTRLGANYPNPFNPTTTIAFDLAQSSPISLRIYNIKGQLVRTLFSGDRSAGTHRIVWNGMDDHNRQVATGVYFYRLDANGFSQTRKMLMVK